MSGIAAGLGFAGESSGAVFALARRKAPSNTPRSPATDLLMAPPCELVLPTLERIPLEHSFAADDRELLTLTRLW